MIEQLALPLENKVVAYLEFGVWKGESLRLWSRLLKNPATVLHGFDSFEGLPEDWQPGAPRGKFGTGGEAPRIDDPRVTFFKGWFQDTLPSYRVPECETLVLFLDADLHSSTLYVLNTLKGHLRIGSILYFDEFSDRHHEQRAFGEFLRDSAMRFELIAADFSLTHVAFRRIG